MRAPIAMAPTGIFEKSSESVEDPDRPDGRRDQLAPFLKWAGGKRSLLTELMQFVPRSIDVYHEPFVGGGALFFELARQQRFKKARLADRNEELIRCYAAIKRDHRQVLAALAGHRYDESAYYRVRELDPADLTDAVSAARTIYLNRCGFNGLYRVNASGRFNVPFGHYVNPRLVNPRRIELVSAALQNTELIVADFEQAVAGVTTDDFVYCDPPYVPVSATSKFTSYASAGFTQADQERLGRLLRRLREEKVRVLLSNSDCPVTRKLYRGLRPRAVGVRRSINSDGAKRGLVSELMVRSFNYSC